MYFRFILLVFFLPVLGHVKSNEPFEIPRSTTIPITDAIQDRDYELFIKLSKSYESSNKKYPVIYLTDAMYTFQIVSGATRYPMTVNTMEEAIIVGISWDKETPAALSRQRDYTPTVKANWEDPTGGAEDYIKFIRDVIFKEVETRFRADSSRRTYVGNSFGGLLGAYILFKDGGMFKNYILGSPSLWYDDRVIFDLEESYSQENDNLRANVFVSIGSLEMPKYQGSGWKHDMVKDTKKFYDTLKKREYLDLKLKLFVIDDATHETDFPTTAIHGLYWLYKI
ncbi:alpha/beta hydrolase [Microbulbifer sp. TYP-18]|uniref:alpha/beta hydrolase n=1 Tax=Microbulbifer sp. TYP-18 TaxID=3230024 RepID=UPI0034C69334